MIGCVCIMKVSVARTTLVCDSALERVDPTSLFSCNEYVGYFEIKRYSVMSIIGRFKNYKIIFCLKFSFFRYVDKFTEFIHSFVQSHLRRFENSLQFPINDFLALLYKYTFGQQRTDGYMACLDIW